ncbi:MAG: hypothetical protein ACR2PR_09275 [Pseudohongiellaceae bacterium]
MTLRRRIAARGGAGKFLKALTTKQVGGSALERETEFYLRMHKIPHEREVELIAGRKLRWDFAIRSKRAVIECQGLVWDGKGAHNTPQGVMRDCEKLNLATLAGWRCFAITNGGGATSPAEVVRKIANL